MNASGSSQTSSGIHSASYKTNPPSAQHPQHHNLHNHHNQNQTNHPHNSSISASFQSYGDDHGTPSLSSRKPITPTFTSTFGRGGGIASTGHLVVQQSPNVRAHHHNNSFDDMPSLILNGDALSSTSKSSRGSNKRIYGRSSTATCGFAPIMIDNDTSSSHSRNNRNQQRTHYNNNHRNVCTNTSTTDCYNSTSVNLDDGDNPGQNPHNHQNSQSSDRTGRNDLNPNRQIRQNNDLNQSQNQSQTVDKNDGQYDLNKSRSVRFSRQPQVANVVIEGGYKQGEANITIQDHHNDHLHLLPNSYSKDNLQNGFDDDISSIDVLDSDEEPQNESGIPFSNTGHLKYPISEQLRYEYLRNDAYHSKLPFLSVPMVERMNVVSEQERWLKTAQMKQAIELQSSIENIENIHNQSASSDAPFFSPIDLGQGDTNSLSSVPLSLTSRPIVMRKKKKQSSSKLTPSSLLKEELLDDFDSHNPLHNPLITQSESDENLARSQSICDWYSRSELIAQLELGIPLILSFSASYGVGLINLSYQGHLSEQALAAAALSLFYMNVTGFSILYGLNSGIDTLGSQMFGSQQHKMVGMIAMRGAVIGMIASIFVAFCWLFSHVPLLLIGVEKSVAELSSEYCSLCIWSIPAILLLDVQRRYLEVQQICFPSMTVNLIGLLAVAPLNSFFMYTLDWGFIGPAYTFIIINYAMCFTLAAYIWGSGIWKQSLPPPSLSVFRNWKQYLSIALPACGSIAGEWLAFELQQVIAARLGTPALAAQSLITSLNAFIYNVPMSIGIAACARIGCFLGARKTSCALLGYFSALRITWVSQLIIASILWAFNNQIIGLFTNVKSVATMAQSVMPLLSIFSIIDGHQGMLQGVLRGFGAQSYAFAMNMFWFWAIALPLSVGISLHAGEHTYDDAIGPEPGLGLVGIWMSLLVGSSGVMISYLFFLGFTNWTKQTSVIYLSLLEEQDQFVHDNASELLPSAAQHRHTDDSSSYSSSLNNSSSVFFSTQSGEEDEISTRMSGIMPSTRANNCSLDNDLVQHSHSHSKEVKSPSSSIRYSEDQQNQQQQNQQQQQQQRTPSAFLQKDKLLKNNAITSSEITNYGTLDDDKLDNSSLLNNVHSEM